MKQNLFEILNLERGALEREIRTRYRRRALIDHPDKGGNEENFKKLIEAYNDWEKSLKSNIANNSVEVEEDDEDFNFEVEVDLDDDNLDLQDNHLKSDEKAPSEALKQKHA